MVLDPVVVESVFSPLNEPTKAHICEIPQKKVVDSVIFGASPVQISLPHPKEPSQTPNCDFSKKIIAETVELGSVCTQTPIFTPKESTQTPKKRDFSKKILRNWWN